MRFYQLTFLLKLCQNNSKQIFSGKANDCKLLMILLRIENNRKEVPLEIIRKNQNRLLIRINQPIKQIWLFNLYD